MKFKLNMLLFSFLLILPVCDRDNPPHNNSNDTLPVYYTPDQFVMGADLSYVNQILDHGGTYSDSGQVADPYKIFKKYGTNVIRFRLFHNPAWTKEVYIPAGDQMYNDFNDVKLGIQRAKEQGMQVCLDFHYSDTWAGTSSQEVPAAWESLTLGALHDSIYNYTFSILKKLDNEGLMPEFVQAGNEINPGFLLPQGNRWNGNTQNFIYLLNSAITAIRQAGAESDINPKIIIHVAQPENAITWFEGLGDNGLTDFDIIGVSYYYMWSDVNLENVSNYIGVLKKNFGKDVIVMETAYPWTTAWDDNYNNILNESRLVSGFPASINGQYEYLKKLTQEIIDGGGKGIFYWEPAWISSNMRDLWGTGSSWECNTLFDFEGDVIKGMKFMTYKYKF